MPKAVKTRAEIYVGNTIEYDLKSSKDKVTIKTYKYMSKRINR